MSRINTRDLPRHCPGRRGSALASWMGLLLLSGSLLACTPVDPKTSSSGQAATESRPQAAGGAQQRLLLSESEAAMVDSDSTQSVAPMIVKGNDRLFAARPDRAPITLNGDAVSLNFEKAPLGEVVDAILGDTLGLDYVVEHPVPGEVTIRTRSPIPRSDLLPILESLLQTNDVLMVRGPDDRFFVSASPRLKAAVPAFGNRPGTGYNAIIVPLQYIGVKEMADILKPVASEDSFVRIDVKRNLLILAGTQVQIEGWLDIVATFDIDQLAGMSVGIFPLVNSLVDDVYTELQQILSADPGSDKGGLGGVVRLMPIQRLNSILAVSPRASYIVAVEQWVKKLDEVADPAAKPTLHVYKVKNGNAGQMASLLSAIYGGGGAATGTGSPSVAPGMAVASASTNGMAGLGGANTNTGGGRTGGGASSIMIGDNVKVVSDTYNNALLIHAPRYEYERIEHTLLKLDVVATQVLIEASIVEVTLTDEFQFGLEWAFKNNLGAGDTGSGLLDLGSGLAAQVPGFSYTVSDSAGAVQAVLNALAKDSLINVISTPSVMVLDNHTASIHVGDQVPIQNQSTVTNGGNVQNSITYKDTGVQLQVTPSVNDGGLVTMDIQQSVTDVGPVDAATRQRSFLERNVSSRVAVRTGESVVLGGLIRDNETSGASGVPLLKDIPLFGNLFKTNSQSATRTELLVFITPRVVEGDQDLRDLNREMRNRMRGLTEFDDLPVTFDEE